MRDSALVVLATDSGRWLPRALDECLRQSFTPLSVIVVDGGSSDETLQHATKVGAHVRRANLPYFSFRVITGASRLAGLRMAMRMVTGECVVLFDPVQNRIEPHWVGSANVALSTCAPDAILSTPPGLVAFRPRLWPEIEDGVVEGTVGSVLAAAPRTYEFRLGEVVGSYGLR